MRLAARGRRDLDGGSELIEDPTELARVKRQARGVHLKSLAVAVLMTLVAVWI